MAILSDDPFALLGFYIIFIACIAILINIIFMRGDINKIRNCVDDIDIHITHFNNRLKLNNEDNTINTHHDDPEDFANSGYSYVSHENYFSATAE